MELMLAIGIDLGGTKTNFGLVRIQNKKFEIIKKKTITSPQEEKKLVSVVLENVQTIINRKVEKIGLSLAGQINFETQKSISSPNIPVLEKISFRKILKKEFGLPVYIENDANAFALAESVFGAACGKERVVGLTLGTGIGGGVIIDGKVYHGAHTSASELGHMIIAADGRKCPCGHQGCLEAYTSATAVVKEYERRTGFKKDAYSIQKEAQDNLGPAKSVLEEAARYLSVGLVNIINIFEPEVIVLGGGFARANELINPAVQKTKKITPGCLGKYIEITRAKLGIDAGMIGATLLK